MESIRKEYKGIFERAVDALQQSGKAFDNPGVFVTQFWGRGYVFLNRTAWMRNKKIWPPPGFYIENLRLELLCDKDEPAPYASIWLPAKKTGVDLSEARKAIVEAAQQLLTKEECERCLKQQEEVEYPLYYDLPEPKDQLLEMLVKGDGQSFVDCMVGHLDLLARFTPVVDKLLGVAAGGQ
ncbi:MAG TPA: hypothetical protein VNE39_12615 [Planctomycetota bacterium]|nr:hypothetical protein [Planctomycetota bacterium]